MAGRRPPLSNGQGALARELQDGGGLYFPGKWPPSRRGFPAFGEEVPAALNRVLDDFEGALRHGFWIRAISSLACVRVLEDPLKGAGLAAKAALEVLATCGMGRGNTLSTHAGAVWLSLHRLVSACKGHRGMQSHNQHQYLSA